MDGDEKKVTSIKGDPENGHPEQFPRPIPYRRGRALTSRRKPIAGVCATRQVNQTIRTDSHTIEDSIRSTTPTDYVRV